MFINIAYIYMYICVFLEVPGPCWDGRCKRLQLVKTNQWPLGKVFHEETMIR